MNHVLLGQLAGLLCLLQSVIYIRSILKGESKPSRAGNAIWFAVGLVGLTSYLAAGATTTIWLSLVLFVASSIVFALSFKYGMGGLQKLDLVCLALAVVAIIVWQVSNNPSFAVYGCLVASLLAYVPVLKKVYLYPSTENKLSWTIYGFACVLNVLALDTVRFVIAGPVVIGLMCDLAVLYCLYHSIFLKRLSDALLTTRQSLLQFEHVVTSLSR